MSDLEKQGERYIVLEAAGGRAPFLVDLAESFGTLAQATAAANAAAADNPGGPMLVVVGVRFCATVIPSGAPKLGSPYLQTQRPKRIPLEAFDDVDNRGLNYRDAPSKMRRLN